MTSPANSFDRAARLYIWGFLLLLALQVGLWTQTKKILPNLGILPPLVNEAQIKASSFGDAQFYFRVLGMEIQNAGDSFGRSTPLKNYDYALLSRWFDVLDGLDAESSLMPSLAAYYYSNTQRKSDVRYIVEYLEKRGDQNPAKNWWWYAQAVYHAKHTLGDEKRALTIAYKLAAAENKEIPIWAKQMPALILADMGDVKNALLLMKQILDNIQDLPPGEVNFMNYFINERLAKIKQQLDSAP